MYNNQPILPWLIDAGSCVPSPKWSKAKASKIMTAHMLRSRKKENGPKAVRKLCRARRLLTQEPMNRHSRQLRRVKWRAGLKAPETVRGKTTEEKASHKATPKSTMPTETAKGAIMIALLARCPLSVNNFSKTGVADLHNWRSEFTRSACYPRRSPRRVLTPVSASNWFPGPTRAQSLLLPAVYHCLPQRQVPVARSSPLRHR
jgi:hypothetical protein